jgi:hypothetical protein
VIFCLIFIFKILYDFLILLILGPIGEAVREALDGGGVPQSPLSGPTNFTFFSIIFFILQEKI